MGTTLWESIRELSLSHQLYFAFAIVIAFAFEFINGFHDTANAVTTVIYTNTLKPTPAVIYSGFCNFLGVLLGGTAVAFAIVNLLPVELLVQSSSVRSIIMVVSLLMAGIIWNLGTWWYGLPVSSSHTLIGSILGVGLANSLITKGNMTGVNWAKATEVALSLLISPLIGFVAAAALLMAMKRLVKEPSLYRPPRDDDNPPGWIRGVLLASCGGVSFAHGSNDGQKGMGLILLVLIGFLPGYYALNVHQAGIADDVRHAVIEIDRSLVGTPVAATVHQELAVITAALQDKSSLAEIDSAQRWAVRESIFRIRKTLSGANLDAATRQSLAPSLKQFDHAIEYVPFWVVLGVALALGVGTTIGYKRIVVTIAEKIGKSHLTYGQGAAAEVVAAATIGLAGRFHLPVSTTHVLSSGVAGTMWANRSGIQGATVKKIGLAWILTMPAAILLSAGLFTLGGVVVPDAHKLPVAPAAATAQTPVAMDVAR